MRKLFKLVLFAGIALLVGSQVEARESATDLGLAVGETVSEMQDYKQSTTIQQFETDNAQATNNTILSTLSYENLDNFSGKLIQTDNSSENNDSQEKILQVETSNDKTTYKQNDSDWQQSPTNDSFLGQLNVFTVDELSSLLSILDATGEWTGSLTDHTVSFQGESEHLTSLLNKIVADSYNSDAVHDVEITVDRQSKEIKNVNWTITGTSRIDNQAITTNILVKLS